MSVFVFVFFCFFFFVAVAFEPKPVPSHVQILHDQFHFSLFIFCFEQPSSDENDKRSEEICKQEKRHKQQDRGEAWFPEAAVVMSVPRRLKRVSDSSPDLP